MTEKSLKREFQPKAGDRVLLFHEFEPCGTLIDYDAIILEIDESDPDNIRCKVRHTNRKGNVEEEWFWVEDDIQPPVEKRHLYIGY